MNKQVKILVVEDEEFLSDIYKEILTDAGYSVETAAEGETAYQMLSQNHYDLVLLDVMLPGMDGKEIIKRLHQNKKISQQGRIVLMTNLVQDALFSEVRKWGVKDHLIKSDFDPGEFLKTVKQFLA